MLEFKWGVRWGLHEATCCPLDKRRRSKHLSFWIWYELYWRFYGNKCWNSCGVYVEAYMKLHAVHWTLVDTLLRQEGTSVKKRKINSSVECEIRCELDIMIVTIVTPDVPMPLTCLVKSFEIIQFILHSSYIMYLCDSSPCMLPIFCG